SAEVPGKIAAIFVRDGDHVEAGASLFALESAVESAALAAAEAELATATATAERILHGNRVEDVDAASAEAAAASARAENAAEVLARTEKLVRAGALPQDELDRARHATRAEEATHAAALARSRAIASGSRHEELAEARARVHAALARRD